MIRLLGVMYGVVATWFAPAMVLAVLALLGLQRGDERGLVGLPAAGDQQVLERRVGRRQRHRDLERTGAQVDQHAADLQVVLVAARG